MAKSKRKFPLKKIAIIIVGFIIFLVLDVIFFVKPFQEYIKGEGGA